MIKYYNKTISLSKFYDITKTRYKVNEEKNIVTCIINSVPNGETFLELSNLGEEYSSEKKFIGIAKCNPMDKFDLITGKDIAEHRAMMEFYNFQKRMFKKLREYHYSAYRSALDGEQWAGYKSENQKKLAKELG